MNTETTVATAVVGCVIAVVVLAVADQGSKRHARQIEQENERRDDIAFAEWGAVKPLTSMNDDGLITRFEWDGEVIMFFPDGHHVVIPGIGL